MVFQGRRNVRKMERSLRFNGEIMTNISIHAGKVLYENFEVYEMGASII